MQRFTQRAIERIPRAPYPELRSVLKRFIEGVQDALKRNFVGAYLVGSLATGDFDLDSDIDFFIVTRESLTDPELRLLQALHREIYRLGCYPSQHLEGSYMDRGSLTRTDLVGVEPVWFIDNGSTSLERSVHDNQWHVRWILRERAIALTGPDPKTLIEPVLNETLRHEMITSLKRLQVQFLAEVDKPLGWFNTRFGQSFTVLTCCRMLDTFQTGAVRSKLAAVQWAEWSLHKEWHALIREAWAEREGVRFGVKVRQPAEVRLLQETARFVTYACNQTR